MGKFQRAHQFLTEDIQENHGLEVEIIPPVEEELLLRIHTPEYVAKLRDRTLSDGEHFRLGLPDHPSLYNRSRLGAAGTVHATAAALDDGIACNLAGGTHHAFPERGTGFCVFNDVALAIRNLQAKDPDLYIMVLDTDAHQGNATHAIFREDERVYTYSIHVGRNFPSKKEPGDMDVGLPRYVSGDEYFDALTKTAEPALLNFEPDLVVWLSGVDPHEEDRFGQMKLSTDQLSARDEYVIDMVRSHEIPLAVLYGGGYHREPDMTARLHANTIQAALRRWKRERGVTLQSPASPSAHHP